MAGGTEAAVAYLRKWLSSAHKLSHAEHRVWYPSEAEVNVYLREQNDLQTSCFDLIRTRMCLCFGFDLREC